MSPELWQAVVLELARNVPAAVAVIITVVIFTRLIRWIITEHRKQTIEAAKACHETQDKGSKAMTKSAGAIGASSVALQGLTGAIARLISKVRPEPAEPTAEKPAPPAPGSPPPI